MTLVELKELFNTKIRVLGVVDIQNIEDEFEMIKTETREMIGQNSLKHVNFYREQIQARKDYVLKILEAA